MTTTTSGKFQKKMPVAVGTLLKQMVPGSVVGTKVTVAVAVGSLLKQQVHCVFKRLGDLASPEVVSLN